MTDQEKAARWLRQADVPSIGIPMGQALDVLRADCSQDEWTAELLNDVATENGLVAVSALLRLLSLYGVGTIVKGQIGRI